MAIGIKSSFNKYKKQGLMDTQAMERAMNDQATGIAKIRKADAVARAVKKKRGTWTSRLKKSVQSVLKSRHSPAGKKHLRKGY